LWDDTEIVKYFKNWYQLWDINKEPKYNIHRKWFWIDFLGFNLETPYMKTWCSDWRFWSISFCSSWEILNTLSKIWFNLVNLANNHTLDSGISWYISTKKYLEQVNFEYFGYIKTNSSLENNVLERNIRWIKTAFHGYNFYNRFSWDINIYCNILDKYDEDKYINIVNVHWWNEYEITHNILQEKIWKKLIDCWADAIIWHHPHVIQDIQRYKNKPIIYSLGNFLFDQYSENTNKWLYVLMNINKSWKIDLWTWEINSTPD
jgi:poly-gamma-glutamate synthesis protein (capsule biosynthesis protein)